MIILLSFPVSLVNENYGNKFKARSRSRIDCDRAIYSASTIDRATFVRNLKTHRRGVPQNIITYSVLERTLVGSHELSLFHRPPISASM